jgi:hypothetical protein
VFNAKIEKEINGDNLYKCKIESQIMTIQTISEKLSKVRDLILIVIFGSILVESVTGIHLLGKWWQ